MSTNLSLKIQSRRMRIVNLLLALALVFGGLGLAVQPAQAGGPEPFTCTEYHTVVRGEYLSMIAKQYGVSWTWLAEINNLSNPSRIYAGQRLCVAGEGDLVEQIPVTGSGSRFTIVKVIEDESVTISLAGYPANREVLVRMGKMGTKGVDGIIAATLKTGKDGTLKSTVSIPKKLHDVHQIAIRVETKTGGYYYYNWFYNRTGTDTNVSISTPSIEISNIESQTSVTLKGKNFPADTKIFVYMDGYGTRAEDGILVDTVRTDKKGSFTKTFEVPKKLRDARRLAIRAQTRYNDVFAYNWFYNRPNP